MEARIERRWRRKRAVHTEQKFDKGFFGRGRRYRGTLLLTQERTGGSAYISVKCCLWLPNKNMSAYRQCMGRERRPMLGQI